MVWVKLLYVGDSKQTWTWEENEKKNAYISTTINVTLVSNERD